MSNGPAIGWKFITWSGTAARCNVPACNREINSGHVSVRAMRPWAGDPAICVDCYFKIMLGVDPDPAARTPQWEEDRRAAANPDR